MLKTYLSRLATLGCLCVCTQVSSAQICQQQVGGSYTYSAIGAGASVTGTSTGTGTGTGTGSTTTTSAFTNSEVGTLLGGLSGTAPFATPGTLFFDGSGNIRGTITPQGGLTATVGTYVLNPDCTISVTLTDAFGSNKTAVNLQGIVASNGSEIDLVMFQGVSGTGTATGTGTGTPSTSSPNALNGSNVLITLVRPLSTFCNVSNLAGSYALIGTGSKAATTGATGSGTGSAQLGTPFYFLARVQFDGNGKIVSQAGGQSQLPVNIIQPTISSSPLGFLQFTGTYTINNDCTGTMTLNNGAGTATGTGTGTGTDTSTSALTLNFVLTQPMTQFNGGSPVVAGSNKPGIQFSMSNSSQSLVGYGRPQ